MSVQWDDLKTIMLLVHHGSLAGAAAALGVSYTTVARRVSRAEAALGERLFERLADGYQPTEAAQLIATHAEAMQDSEDAMMRQLMGRDARLTGTLTLTAPQLMVECVLAPTLARFSQAHPEVELIVKATNDKLDLNRREADMGIRVSRDPGDTLQGLRLTEQHSAVFATPALAARMAAAPNAQIDWIVFKELVSLPKQVRAAFPNARARYIFDDMVAMIGAAKAGLGALRMPMILGRNCPELVQVPQIAPWPYMDIWLVGHPDVWPGAKLKAFRDMLKADLRPRKSEFLG